MSSIGGRIAKGATWMVGLTLCIRLLGLASTVILARLLDTDDFGMVAMATVVIGALELLTSLSLDIALIQDQDAGREKYDTAWTLNLLLSAGLAVLLAALAVPVAAFYDEPAVVPVFLALAAGPFIEGFENIGKVAFRKEMTFHKEFAFLASKKIIAFVVTISAALALRSYWALVIGILTSRLAGVVLSYLMQSFRPRLRLAEWRGLFHFSKWLAANNLLFFLRNRVSDIIVGRVISTQALGLFSVGYEVSNLATTELVAPINRAIFPGYAKIAGDRAALRRSYLDVIGMIALIAVPTALGIGATASLVVPLMLGSKWLDVIPLVRILAFAGVIAALETNIGSVYWAIGKPRILTVLYGINVAILIACLLGFTAAAGIEGAAWACLVAALINLPIYYGAMLRTLELRLVDLLAVLWRPLVAAGAMYLAVEALVGAFGPAAGILALGWRAAAAVGAGAVIYIALALALWRFAGRPTGAETLVLSRARKAAGATLDRWRRR